MGVVIRENKELIELAVVVVVEGVSASTAKDVLSNAAIKDVVPVAALSSSLLKRRSSSRPPPPPRKSSPAPASKKSCAQDCPLAP